MRFRRAAGFLALLCIVFAAGCPSSEEADTGNTVIELVIEVEDSERLSDVFNSARIKLSNFTVSSLDEGAASVIGDKTIKALVSNESLRLGELGDLDLTRPLFETQMYLSSGNYRIDSIVLGNSQFVSDAAVGRCGDGTICACDDPLPSPPAGETCESAGCSGMCTVSACGNRLARTWGQSTGEDAVFADVGVLEVKGGRQTLTIRMLGSELVLAFIESHAASGNCSFDRPTDLDAWVDLVDKYLEIEL